MAQIPLVHWDDPDVDPRPRHECVRNLMPGVQPEATTSTCVLRQASLNISALVKAAKSPAEKVTVAAAHADWSVPALWVFLGSYVIFAAVTWLVYVRPGPAEEGTSEVGKRRGLMV